MNADLLRCDREIAEASEEMKAPAWMVTLWAEDWQAERRMIEQEIRSLAGRQSRTTPSVDL